LAWLISGKTAAICMATLTSTLTKAFPEIDNSPFVCLLSEMLKSNVRGEHDGATMEHESFENLDVSSSDVSLDE